MKTRYLGFLVCFLLAGNTLVSAASCTKTNKKWRFTREKTIEKEYDVNPDALLQIANQYGDVKLTSWSENRVVIEVHIITEGNDEKETARRLEEIDVAFSSSPSRVSAKTIIERESRSWWSRWGNSSNTNLEINYTVKLPITNSVSISNDYGGIYLNSLKGRAELSCDYGRLVIGELLANDNELSFDYTSNSTIAYMEGGSISADYSDFSIEESGRINLNADYTKSRFNKIKSLDFTCDYGDFEANEIQDTNGSGDYLTIKLGEVSGDVNLSADYGAISINKLTPQAGNVTIDAEYASVKLGYAESYHFNFEIDLEYAGLSGDRDFEMVKKRIESTDKYYEGYYGSANAKNTVKITSEYGGVSFSRK